MTPRRPLVLLDALFYQDDRQLEDSTLSLVDMLAKKFFLKNPEYTELEEARRDAIALVALIMFERPAPMIPVIPDCERKETT